MRVKNIERGIFIDWHKYLAIDFFKKYLLLALLLVFWSIFSEYIYPQFNPQASNILPTPHSVVAIGWDLLKRGELFIHVMASLHRVLIGFLISALIGIPVGIFMGISVKAKSQLSSLVEVLRSIPPFAWIPLILLWFGIGDTGSIFIIVIATVFPIILNTIHGIENVKMEHILAGQSLGCVERKDILLSVVLPSALSRIFLGLRIGLGYSWRVLVSAEFLGSVSGLGYLILDSRNLGLPNLAFLGMLVIAAIGYTLDFGIRIIGNYFLIWRE